MRPAAEDGRSGGEGGGKKKKGDRIGEEEQKRTWERRETEKKRKRDRKFDRRGPGSCRIRPATAGRTSSFYRAANFDQLSIGFLSAKSNLHRLEEVAVSAVS